MQGNIHIRYIYIYTLPFYESVKDGCLQLIHQHVHVGVGVWSLWGSASGPVTNGLAMSGWNSGSNEVARASMDSMPISCWKASSATGSCGGVGGWVVASSLSSQTQVPFKSMTATRWSWSAPHCSFCCPILAAAMCTCPSRLCCTYPLTYHAWLKVRLVLAANHCASSLIGVSRALQPFTRNDPQIEFCRLSPVSWLIS